MDVYSSGGGVRDHTDELFEQGVNWVMELVRIGFAVRPDGIVHLDMHGNSRSLCAGAWVPCTIA